MRRFKLHTKTTLLSSVLIVAMLVAALVVTSVATMPITRILDITVEKPLLGRILGYGHFVFESAAQAQGLRDIRFIGDPDERDLTIQRVVQRSGLRTRSPIDRQMMGG